MSLATQMARDLQNVFFNASEFGSTVTWTPKGGSGSAVPAVVGDERVVEEMRDDGTWRMREVPVAVALADVAAPAVEDAVTIGSEEWQVVSIAGKDAAGFVAVLRRPALVEKARTGYRT